MKKNCIVNYMAIAISWMIGTIIVFSLCIAIKQYTVALFSFVPGLIIVSPIIMRNENIISHKKGVNKR